MVALYCLSRNCSGKLLVFLSPPLYPSCSETRLQAMAALCAGQQAVVDYVMVDCYDFGHDSLQVLFFLVFT